MRTRAGGSLLTHKNIGHSQAPHCISNMRQQAPNIDSMRLINIHPLRRRGAEQTIPQAALHHTTGILSLTKNI
jgi:hypothetical protein